VHDEPEVDSREMAVKTRILAWGHGFPGPLHGVRAGSADVEMEIFREVVQETEELMGASPF